MARFCYRRIPRTVKSPLGSPSRFYAPFGDIATPRHSPPRTAPTTEWKRRLKRLLHHCLREMSRTREVEVYPGIIKLDPSAPYFVQSRTLVRYEPNRSAAVVGPRHG